MDAVEKCFLCRISPEVPTSPTVPVSISGKQLPRL
eukprot:CAMPEP_0116838000 /NCGR_PEP_ID=MMETSP0418-20121206/8967_1 /TAXON_ID=1158023 /ORGANISM="Astrosyne radiata, Strain 13vi08-1A" /LENGTH=34 /DNA_ID= /DNA_START= /DNA_END= /DNA_ORIENTATION=